MPQRAHVRVIHLSSLLTQMLEFAQRMTLSMDQLRDKAVVREKVRNLNKLGEQRWRYRVVEEGQSPRDAAIEVLKKAAQYIQARIGRFSFGKGTVEG